MEVERQLSDPAGWDEQHGEYLLRYALQHVRDRHAAQDLVQETWLAALQSVARFEGRSSERTWLAGILRHKAIDHIRKSCRERLSSHASHYRFDSAACHADTTWCGAGTASWVDPARWLEKQQLMAALDRCLSGLPSRTRIVFALCDLEEMPHADVAHRLGVTDNNLYVLLHRARRKIRQYLAVFDGADQTLDSPEQGRSHLLRP